MKKIYAPWRNNYVTKELKTHKPVESEKECVFCSQFSANDDKKYFILKRYKHCAVVLNFYPYNAGHLMVLPFAHKAGLNDLTDEERNEIFRVSSECVEVLKKGMEPKGFNVGLNLGDAGGGGIPSHLHVHVLPRWSGDTNFLPALAGTKVICSDFNEIYELLKPLFD